MSSYTFVSPHFHRLALGSDATEPKLGDTMLANEVFRDTLVSTTVSTLSSPPTITYDFVLGTGSANGSTLRDAGLFNAAAGGTLLARMLLSPEIEKTSSNAYTFDWVIRPCVI